jgi:hypothetical protein
VLSRDPHRPFDLLAKVNELNRRVRDLELRDFATRAELPPASPGPAPYALAASRSITHWEMNATGLWTPEFRDFNQVRGDFNLVYPNPNFDYGGVSLPEEGTYFVHLSWQFYLPVNHGEFPVGTAPLFFMPGWLDGSQVGATDAASAHMISHEENQLLLPSTGVNLNWASSISFVFVSLGGASNVQVGMNTLNFYTDTFVPWTATFDDDPGGQATMAIVKVA